MAVPGCPGGEEENSRTDFCVDPTDLVEEALEDPTIETAGPSGENYSDLTMVPTLDATIDGTIDGSMTVTEDLLPPLETLGNDGAPADVYPLGLCQGGKFENDCY